MASQDKSTVANVSRKKQLSGSLSLPLLDGIKSYEMSNGSIQEFHSEAEDSNDDDVIELN